MGYGELGTRMKGYERPFQHRLPPKQAVVIRVDGRAFHTWTRSCDKPFDRGLMDTMVDTTIVVAKEMVGFKLAYHQSDEVSFLITDNDTYQSQGWFGYELSKIVSVTASIFTAHFNDRYAYERDLTPLATFDARAFAIPLIDVPNYFVWRQQDWARNSLSMLAQSVYTARELHGKNQTQIHDMLHAKGLNWARCTDAEKNGTFVRRDRSAVSGRYDYAAIQDWIDPPREETA